MFQTPDRSGVRVWALTVLEASASMTPAKADVATHLAVRCVMRFGICSSLWDAAEDLELRSCGGLQFVSVDDGLRDPQRIGAALGPPACQRDLVTSVRRGRFPAGSDQMFGAGELALPLLELAVLGFRVDMHDA